MHILYFLLIGLIAGWLVGQIMKGKGFRLAGNVIVGCIGAFIGGFLFDLLGIFPMGSSGRSLLHSLELWCFYGVLVL